MRYAQRINRARGWKGHVWQGRFFSSPLDEAYLWAAMRYVERNPVRAKMVRKAENYRWSSAAAHCRVREDEVLTKSQAGASNSKRLAIGPPGWPRVTRRSNWKSCGATEEEPALRFGEIHPQTGNAGRTRVTLPTTGRRGKTTVKRVASPLFSTPPKEVSAVPLWSQFTEFPAQDASSDVFGLPDGCTVPEW